MNLAALSVIYRWDLLPFKPVAIDTKKMPRAMARWSFAVINTYVLISARMLLSRLAFPLLFPMVGCPYCSVRDEPFHADSGSSSQSMARLSTWFGTIQLA
jgi:hypothetical protein